MSYDDKKFGAVFPVRTGSPTGASNERQMLDHLGGSESFRKTYRTMPDGSIVRCDTKNGMPRFTHEGGQVEVTGCALKMDSGVADLKSISDYSPLLMAPTTVHYTDYVAGSADSSTPVGMGTIRYPKFTGNNVPDGAIAEAFSPDYAGATNFTDRKKIAAKIPPSIFTGRTRLYVQSLYGGTWGQLILADPTHGMGRPVLSVNSMNREQNGLPSANIGSGSGIFFDNATKKHFLIVLDSTSAFVMPLVASPCAEKYRALLLQDTLAPADAERIESYILSQSVPIPEMSQELSFEETPSECFGYSWHFNWSGNRCDIVDVQEIGIVDGSYNIYGFKSTHYRLTFSLSNGVFSVQRDVISGPDIWSVPKHINVIAYPDWGGKLVKAGNLPSRILEGSRSASVYCYYVKDELKVLTVNTQKIPAGEKTRESSPEYFGGKSHDYITAYLKETESGESVARNTLGGTRCAFEVDGVVVGGYTDSVTKSTYTATWVGRLPFTVATGHGVDWDSGSAVINSPDGVWGPLTFDIGAPTLDYTLDGLGRVSNMTATWEQYTDYNRGYATVVRYFYVGLWQVESSGTTESRSCKTLVIIPYFDSEAVYVTDENYTIETGSKSTETSGLDVYGATAASVLYHGSSEYTDLGMHEVFRFGGFPLARGYIPSVTSDVNEIDTQTSARIISSAGTFTPAKMPGYGDFFSTLSAVSQNYMTLSSVNGAIVSSATGVESGSPSFPHTMSFLGWA